MLLTQLTTYDEVRAVLGVSTTELPDQNLALTQHSTLVTLDLEDLHEGLPSQYLTISALPEASRSSAQQRLYDLCRLYASYSIAKHLLTSLPLFAVLSLTDGKAEFSRISDPFSDTKAAVQAMYATLRIKLSRVYVVLNPSEVVAADATFSIVLAATLGTDPVTTTTV